MPSSACLGQELETGIICTIIILQLKQMIVRNDSGGVPLRDPMKTEAPASGEERGRETGLDLLPRDAVRPVCMHIVSKGANHNKPLSSDSPALCCSVSAQPAPKNATLG